MIHAFTVALTERKSPVLSLRPENRHTEMRALRPPAEALLQDCLARLEEKVIPRTKFTFAFRLIWVKAKNSVFPIGPGEAFNTQFTLKITF
jgi:hypothetical protein